jgi:hypothetical protein
VQAEQFMNQQDVEFVQAVSADIESRGGRFTLPFVPRLPPPPKFARDERPEVLATFGWLRLSFGDTSGDKWHGFGCPRVRDPLPGDRPATKTWWEVSLAPDHLYCGVCWGPGLHHLVEVAHFAAASDVWAARGGADIEPWQRVALVRLIGAAGEDAAFAGDGDPSLAARVTDALMDDLPEEDGDRAYQLFIQGRYGYPPHNLGDAEVEQSLRLARERLERVRELLPPDQSPLPLPRSATIEQLRRHHAAVAAVVLGPCLDRVLFGMPNYR